MPLSLNEIVIGFISRRPNSIGMMEWIRFAKKHCSLVQTDTVAGINPFTRLPVDLHCPYCFEVMSEGQKVGKVTWEQSEAIVVTGVHKQVEKVVMEVCEALRATYEPLNP